MEAGPSCPHHNNFQDCVSCQIELADGWNTDSTLNYDSFEDVTNISEKQPLYMQIQEDPPAGRMFEVDPKQRVSMLEGQEQMETENYGIEDEMLVAEGRNEMQLSQECMLTENDGTEYTMLEDGERHIVLQSQDILSSGCDIMVNDGSTNVACDVSENVASDDSENVASDDSENVVSDDSEIVVSDDSEIVVSDDSEIVVSDDSENAAQILGNVTQAVDLLKKLQVKKLREVLDIKILEDNSKDQLTESTIETESRPLLSEMYNEFQQRSTQKHEEATAEELQFFEYAKSVLLGKKYNSANNFSTIQPAPKVSANFFLKFICEENKHCTNPKILIKFLIIIQAILSIPQIVINDKQFVLLIKFLLHCLFIDMHSIQHIQFRQVVAQTLAVFTNGPSVISKKLYSDIVCHFKKIIEFFPLDLFHWYAILITVKLMGVSAIKSIMIPNFSRICDLLDKSLKSLESFNEIPTCTREKDISDKEFEQRKLFTEAIKIYMDASNLRALLLKMCAILIEDVMKEDIRTDARVIYVPEEINDLCNEGGHELEEPKPVMYKFDHTEFKPFF